jgi:protein involved in plasmid replication-relaxation
VREGARYGFFLEYDRGTETAGKYAAKFRAYYRYRDSGEARRDYDGFPTLLFVTTDPKAEDRIAEQAYRAWFVRGGDPLAILITTTDRIAHHREGIVGPLWQTPADPDRHYWSPGGAAAGLVGARGERVRMPALAWPAAGDQASKILGDTKRRT